MAIVQPHPTRVHRSTPLATRDQRIGRAAVASYTGRQARRRVGRRGFGLPVLDAVRQAGVAR